MAEFANISGMHINVPKTVGIPLWEAPLVAVAAEIALISPEWVALPLSRSAVYLGCVVGPEKMGVAWDIAAKRFSQRVGAWPWHTMGFYLSIVAYNMYMLPIMSFTAQVAPPTEAVRELEQWALRRVAPGPELGPCQQT